MIDIIFLSSGNAQPDHFLYKIQKILSPQYSVLFVVRNFLAKPSVHFISSHLSQIITIEPEKHGMDKLAGVIGGGHITRTYSFVDLLQSFRFIGGPVSCQSGVYIRSLVFILNHINILKKFFYFFVSLITERPEQGSNGYFPLSINPYPNNFVHIGFQFQPSSSVRNYFTSVIFLSFYVIGGKNDSGASYQLGHHHSFDSVYNESSVFGHKREIPQKYFLLNGFLGSFVGQTGFHS